MDGSMWSCLVGRIFIQDVLTTFCSSRKREV
jgi:hypothetical protein